MNVRIPANRGITCASIGRYGGPLTAGDYLAPAQGFATPRRGAPGGDGGGGDGSLARLPRPARAAPAGVAAGAGLLGTGLVRSSRLQACRSRAHTSARSRG